MKPYAINIKLPGLSTPKTVVVLAPSGPAAWEKAQREYPGAKFLNITWNGKEVSA